MLRLYDLFDNNCRHFANHTALVKDDSRINYGDLGKRVNSLAHSLHKLGVEPGTKVGFMFRNCFAFVEIFYALQKIGAVAVPYCYAFKEPELIYNTNNAACSYFIYDQDYISLINNIKADIPTVHTYIHNGTKFTDGEYDLEHLTVSGDPNWTFVNPTGPDDHAMYLFTSGSTGNSKCVVHSQDNMLQFVTLPHLQSLAIKQDDVFFYYAPLYHLAGVTYLMYVMTVAATLIMADGFNEENILKIWEEEKVTQSFLIPPAFINRLEAAPNWETVDLSSMRCLYMSGAVNTPEYARKVYNKMPYVTISNSYGHSERAANTILYLTKEEFERRPELVNSIGRITQYTDMKLVDENGNPANPGEAYAKCPGMLKGYLNMESPFVDGWFPTGDFLRVDEEGYYWFMDRVKQMIKTGGENVFTIKVENVIKQHPAIANCAVVGLPDPVYSEAVCAAVILKPGMTITRQELRDFCDQYLANFEKPRHIYIVDTLPITATNKIHKPTLIEMLKNSTPIE